MDNLEKKSRIEERVRDDLNRIRKLRNVLPGDLSEICSKIETGGKCRIIANRKKGWKMVTRLNSRFHRYTDGPQGREAKFNRKFIKADENGGSLEAVVCFPPDKEPYLVTDEINGGTYNFVSPIKKTFPYVTPRILWGHWKRDMIPYIREKHRKEMEKREKKGQNGANGEQQ